MDLCIFHRYSFAERLWKKTSILNKTISFCAMRLFTYLLNGPRIIVQINCCQKTIVNSSKKTSKTNATKEMDILVTTERRNRFPI